MSRRLKASPPGFALIAVILALFGSGCTVHQKAGARIRSFAPFEHHYIRFIPAQTYLKSRTALLITGDSLPSPDWQKGIFRARDVYAGCAAAVDHRGYFLTAAHCVDDGPVYLVLAASDKPLRAMRARTVWRGNLQNDEPDLALLHIPERLDGVFDLASAPDKDDPVMAVGMARTKTKIQGPLCMGGRVLERKGQPKEGTPDSKVRHDIPLQQGDSGGPLLNEAGRLIGVNIEGTLAFVRFLPGYRYPESVAERPDPEWLADLIEKDAANPCEEPREVFVFRPPGQK